MADKAYQKAQQAYDAMEHPDYWDDREDEGRLEWDELSNDGQKRRMERNYEEADRRSKELKEDALMRSIKRLPGDHDGWPSDEQLEYFKRGGR
jgi:hypothetical protein